MRAFCNALALIIAALLMLGPAGCGESQDDRYNVVLICLDTVRYDAFWLAETAGLEDWFSGWAELAVRFRRAHTVSPWTVPALASVMTGLLPAQHGAGRFPGTPANLEEQIPTGLPDRFETLGEILAARGYRTASFSSHLWTQIDSYGLSQGFQDRIDVRDDEILPEVMIWLLRRQASERPPPFFLNIHWMAAHDWHQKPIAIIRHELDALDEELAEAAARQLPFHTPPHEEADRLRYLQYSRAIAELRLRTARLLVGLLDSGLLSQTLVLLYSDHGEEFGDHRSRAEQEASDPRGLYGRGHGQSLHQELLRIPLLAWIPHQNGRDVDAPVSLIDIFPTILNWTGQDAGPQTPFAMDLRAMLQSGDETFLGRPLFASGIAYGPPKAAVLSGAWKLIRFHDERYQLFDLASDPGESTPRTDQPDRVAELLGLLEQVQTSPGPLPPPPSITPQELERLRSLGYISAVKPDN